MLPEYEPCTWTFWFYKSYMLAIRLKRNTVFRGLFRKGANRLVGHESLICGFQLTSNGDLNFRYEVHL